MHAFWEIVVSNTLIVVALAGGIALLGRFWKNPAGLHLLWIFVLLKLVTPPVLTIPVPLWVPPLTTAPRERSENREMVQVPGVGSKEISGTETAAAMVNGHPPQVVENQRFVESPGPSVLSTPAGAVRNSRSGPAILAWAWAAGIVVLSFIRGYRILQFRRLLRAAEAPPPAVLGMVARIGKRLGLRRIPPIHMLSLRVSPMVWSLGGGPRIYLPSELFKRLSGTAQEAILAHELAHVRRRDHWVRLLETVITTLFWWHPVAWWACRRLQDLEEQCCDGMVLGLTSNGARSYAAALMDALEFLSARPVAAPLGATAARTFTSLSRRITMLKNPSPVLRLTLGRLVLLAVAAAVPMVIAFAAEPTKTDAPSYSDVQRSVEKSADQSRNIQESVEALPKKKPLVMIKLNMVEIPKSSDIVHRLPSGAMILSETEVKNLLENAQNDKRANVLAAPCLTTALGREVEMRVVHGNGVLSCRVLPEAAGKDALALRIKPHLTEPGQVETSGDREKETERWRTSIHAELRNGEAVVFGGWEKAKNNSGDNGLVTVFIVQAKYLEPQAELVAIPPVTQAARDDVSERSADALPETKSLPLPPDLQKPVVGENFVIVPFTSELQRASRETHKDARLFVVINGAALINEDNSKLDTAALDFDTLHKAMKRYLLAGVREPGDVIIHICLTESQIRAREKGLWFSADEALKSFLERNTPVPIGPHGVEVVHHTDWKYENDWKDLVADLSVLPSKEDIRRESGIGDDLVKVYPICTPLGRFLHGNGENCVIRNLKALDRLTPEEIQTFPERVKTYAAKLNIKEPLKFGFFVDFGPVMSKTRHAWHLLHLDHWSWWNEKGLPLQILSVWSVRGPNRPQLWIQVDDENGVSIKDVKISVEFSPEIKDYNDKVKFTKQEDGRWRSVGLLCNDEFTLNVESPGYEPDSRILTLPEGTVKELEVRLKKK
jgi:beta-lactamase regulating signal transducer with metallopeptidase domain